MDACLLHEETNGQSPEYRPYIPFLIHTTKYRVKFGDSWCFLAEAMTQREIGRVAERDPSSAPRVPIVYHIFQDEQRTYAITEFVETINVERDIFVTKVATAVLWLRRQPAPPGVVLGPLGSGFAWHSIFKRKHAPLPFTSVEALERLLNQAVSYMQRQQPGLAKIRIADDPLVLPQSDMDSSNFAVDPMGRTVILDFGEIGWLPASLANFTLLETSGFARDVSVHVFGDRLKSVVASSNLDSLYAVKVCLGTASRSNLGLDKDGNPAT